MTPEQCLQRAEAAYLKAARCMDRDAQKTFEQIAKDWAVMAETIRRDQHHRRLTQRASA